MKLTLLGSAAAEAWPALFCTCDACREATRRGGRNLRRRTAYLVNEDTLVDFGPDIHWQCHAFGVDLCRIRRILFTHSHHDHLAPVELQWRHRGFSVTTERIDVFGNAQVFERLRGEGTFPIEELAIDAHVLNPGQDVTAGPFTVTPLRAQHASDAETALNFILHDGQRGLLIANDTGWWMEDSWQLVAGRRLDAAVIECTYLHKDPRQRSHHLGAEAAVDFRDRLLELGALRPDGQAIVNHFSHNGLTLHEEICAWFEPHGIEVGYDGLVVSI
jgi:phosphoribosyl 1,2-cyclic phosphate phosphodiesterase